MARHNRRRHVSNEVARQSRPDAPPRRATSRPWDDLAFNRPNDYQRSASVALRADRIRQTLLAAYKARVADALRKAPTRLPGRFSFGAWSLPPSLLSQVPTERLIAADACARRSMRRQVLFAFKSTGKGSGSRKKHYSNRSCK